MIFFKIPKKLVKVIHCLIARFWWGSYGNKNKTPNKEVGRLGFRDLVSVMTEFTCLN